MKDIAKRFINKWKYYHSNDYRYLKYWYRLPVDTKSVMLEAGRGEQANGSSFALLRELEYNSKWAEYTPYFVTTDASRTLLQSKISYYGFKRVRLLTRESDEYYKLLSTCRYFFTDNTYPAEFCKKPDQILANTWHGTPLKKMGKAVLDGARGLGNVQRNYFMADYSLFPNDLTRDVFLDDYMLRNQFSGQIVMLDYPRNDAFHNDEMRERVRAEQNIDDFQVIAYMPTWRGLDAKNVNTDAQTESIADYLHDIDTRLNDKQVLYVNLHPFVGKDLDYDDYEHIRPFPEQYETYDFLNASDILITDYSSVMFDYAQTNRPILLFTYDYDEYMLNRGVYIDIKDLPFTRCDNVDELLNRISNSENMDYSAFLKEYSCYKGKSTKSYSEQFLDLVINGDAGDIHPYKIDNQLPIYHIAVAQLEHGLSDKVRKTINKRVSEGYRVVVSFTGGMKASYIPALSELTAMEGVDFYSLIGGLNDRDMPREVSRVFPGWNVGGYIVDGDLTRAHMRLTYRLIPAYSYFIKDSGNDIVFNFKKRNLSFLNSARMAGNDYALVESNGNYSIHIPKEDVTKMKTRNKVLLLDANGTEYKIIAGRRLNKKIKILHPVIFRLANSLVCYLREYIGGADLIVRRENYTDKMAERIKLGIAYVFAKISRSARPVILYEKDSERYEESASILYERLLDEGYKNVYYILDKNNPQRTFVPDKYKSNILDKYSFKHYYKLFKAKSLIATETVPHSLDITCVSPFVRYWLQHAGFNYVFLQHGPTYMISLDSEGRGFYKQQVREGYVNRTVVSSKLEADHFITLGDAPPDTLYNCGMLKFDRAVRNEVHDRIVIMPTWRPWEKVIAAQDFVTTGYYKLVKEMCDCVPENLKDKIVVLPHPLFKQFVMESGDDLRDMMLPELSHEEVLRMTDTLITDYSSISYDAFYRGCNIIFYWKEKDDCVAQYGKTTKLMLTEDLAFGPVCYDSAKLTVAVNHVYGTDQQDEYIERFRKIVAFHDNKNTDRFIEMIKEDNIL